MITPVKSFDETRSASILVFLISLDINCVFFCFLCSRFGKHRKDERPEEKIDRKGSSKWRPEETQVSDEETMKMRMEQERLGLHDDTTAKSVVSSIMTISILPYCSSS